MERLDQDSEALDGFREKRKESERRSSEWAREITYEAEIGIVLKDTLRISPKGVEWKGQLMALDAITGVRWGSVRHSVNGIPTGTNYTMVVSDDRSGLVNETKRGEVYEA
jgi:hypothetical protein